MLLVSVSPNNIAWSGRSISWGVPKPFFTIEDGTLRAHNNPVPRWQPGPVGAVKNMLGHIYLADRIMTAIDPDGWLAYGSSSRGAGDPVAVSCLLLARLKAELDKLGAHAVLVPEPTRSDLGSTVGPPSGVAQAVACGGRLGYRVVPSVAAVAADYQAEPQRTAAYFRDETHYTESGSRRLAEIVAAALPPAPGRE
jgi:hypothetical protein